MGNDLPLTGNLAGSNKSEEIIELWRWSTRNKHQCKDYLTFELMCAVVHLSPEALQIKTI